MGTNAKLLDEAIGALDLLSIQLHGARFDQDENLDVARSIAGELQGMSRVRSVRMEARDDEGRDLEIFRVFATFGIRKLKEDVKEYPEHAVEDAAIAFRIESTFRADYEIKKEVSRESLTEFARVNAVHNIWPFWREFVFNLVGRSGLPDIHIGLYAPRRD